MKLYNRHGDDISPANEHLIKTYGNERKTITDFYQELIYDFEMDN